MRTSSVEPGRDDATVLQQQDVRDARRDLLDVVSDQHRGRGVRVGGEAGQPAQQVLTAAEIHPGGRLVQKQQFGIGHQRPRDLHPLPLALAERAVGALGQRADADPVEQLAARRTSRRP